METFRKIAVGDKLKAIDVCKMNGSDDEALIIGKEYEIENVENGGIHITSELGEHRFDISELSDFFETPLSREAEYREALETIIKAYFSNKRACPRLLPNAISSAKKLLKEK